MATGKTSTRLGCHRVGAKGQVVISKEIRDRLGVQPGWRALQMIIDDHVELYFLPPDHNKSLKGSLSKYTKGRFQTGEDWEKAEELAWQKAVEEEYSQS